MWYFQNNRTKSDVSNNGSAKVQKPTPREAPINISSSPAEVIQPRTQRQTAFASPEQVISTSANLNDEIENAMRDVRPEEKVLDIG